MRKSEPPTYVAIAITFGVLAMSIEDNAASAQNTVAGEDIAEHYEAELLEELHYAHEDFVRIYESLPKDEDGKVDWERAVSNGLINPVASIDSETTNERIMDLRVVIKFNDMLVKDVVFSHEIHTYWLNCESCHPRLFVPDVGSNPMTMQDIREGRYCGACHGMVAFPTNVIDAPNFRANCLRCHRAQRG